MLRHSFDENDGPVRGTVPRPGRSALKSPLQVGWLFGARSKVAVPAKGKGGLTAALIGLAVGSLTTKVEGSAITYAERVIVISPRCSVTLAEKFASSERKRERENLKALKDGLSGCPLV